MVGIHKAASLEHALKVCFFDRGESSSSILFCWRLSYEFECSWRIQSELLIGVVTRIRCIGRIQSELLIGVVTRIKYNYELFLHNFCIQV